MFQVDLFLAKSNGWHSLRTMLCVEHGLIFTADQRSLRVCAHWAIWRACQAASIHTGLEGCGRAAPCLGAQDQSAVLEVVRPSQKQQKGGWRGDLTRL